MSHTRMAVARFTAPPSWLRIMACMIRDEHPHAARELQRAVNRPGNMAELSEAEFHALRAAAPWPTLIANELERAGEALAKAVSEEAARPRGTALGGPSPHSAYHARCKSRLKP